MPRRILIILRSFRGETMQNSAKCYSLPHGFTIALYLHADALKFNFKVTNKKTTTTGKKDAMQQKL